MERVVRRHGAFYAVSLASLVASFVVASPAGATGGGPSAPRAVHASGIATSISVRWARPASSGSSAIREYVVTSRPSARTCVTRTTTCVVKGLKPGSAYTFKVVARNSNGPSAAGTSNQVRVAKASAYFESSLTAFGNLSAAAEAALTNAVTSAQQQKELKALTKSFDSLITSLTREQWPASASTDMTSFVGDFRQIASATANSFEAASSTAAEQDYDNLQALTNKEIFVEAKVFTDLGLSLPIVTSIGTTLSPASVTTAETIHDFFGDDLSVTATQIVAPASAAPGSGLPDAGYQLVAVDLSLANQSTSTIAGNANYSTVAVGSDGQTYTADYGSVSECTSFNYGDFDLAPSDSTTGCVVFELPTNVTIQTIQFSLAPGYLDTAEWSG